MSKSSVKGLKSCPKCKADSIFLPLIAAAGYDGKLYGSRSEGFCNNPQCDQLLWYYPRSGRVTRRNAGQTLAEYQEQQDRQFRDLRFINTMRRLHNLSPVQEMPDALWSTMASIRPPLSLIARLRRIPAEWFWYIVAALKSPFLGKLPPAEVRGLQAGVLTINEARELAQHPRHEGDSDEG